MDPQIMDIQIMDTQIMKTQIIDMVGHGQQRSCPHKAKLDDFSTDTDRRYTM